jgi:hypothetical protein
VKKFLYKSLALISPFVLLYLITMAGYSISQGDLVRLGYLPKDNAYRKEFKKEIDKPIFYENLASIDTNANLKYNVLTIGDSFSEQYGFGYKNYLAESGCISVIHYNRREKDINPIQVLYGLLNGDLFDKLSVDYIILESDEREFCSRAENLNKNDKIYLKDIIQNDFKNHKIESDKLKTIIPTAALLKFPIFSILYHFKDNAFLSEAYCVNTTKSMFTGKRKNKLLFHATDITGTQKNNDKKAVIVLNHELNNLASLLSQKGINLIVLPSPDKYDIYYEYIQYKENYSKPLFFNYIEKMKKDYLYVDSKEILDSAIIKKKDIYFFDDTHWSPWGSQLIASKLAMIISNNYKAQTHNSVYYK